MVNSSTIRRACNNLFWLGLLSGVFLYSLAFAFGGTFAMKEMVMDIHPLFQILWGSVLTWMVGINREELVRLYRIIPSALEDHPPTITAWQSLSRKEMEAVVLNLADKVRQGRITALNISILPGKDESLLLSGIINEGQGGQPIIQLTQQGTTDPSGALSSANFKGDKE